MSSGAKKSRAPASELLLAIEGEKPGGHARVARGFESLAPGADLSFARERQARPGYFGDRTRRRSCKWGRSPGAIVGAVADRAGPSWWTLDE
jgi:hypothetical protein